MILFGPLKDNQITADGFEAWPPHMRTEFANLAAERIAEHTLTATIVIQHTGIAHKRRVAAQGQRHSFAIEYNPDAVPESQATSMPHRLGWRNARNSDA